MKALGPTFLCIIVSLLSATFVVGQISPPSPLLNLPSMTPPSPNAISLGKYGDIPVGLYTGIPNINIPLYTIKVGTFTLPISLSYHSQGLKVEENAGWIGLGWSLNAGGAITRTLHGLPDDGPGGYWNYPNWTNDSIANLGPGTGLFFGGAIGGGLYDLQPDLFYFNFGSHSGKFVMDATPTHTAHFIPFDNYKLTYRLNPGVSNEITQFQMTDDDGNIYIFGAFETTTDESSTTNIAAYNSAWYLTEIITHSGNIYFTYSTETTFSYQVSEMDYLNTDGSNPDDQFNPGYSPPLLRYLSNNSVILSSISFPTGVITFNKTANRKDFPQASAITGMTATDMNGSLQHKFIFSESYFGDTSSTSSAVRLKLDSVTEVSVTGSTQKKQYKFIYNNPSGVPSVQSLAQDFWGFYNGQYENTSLLPQLDPAIYGAYISGQQGSHHGNRNPSASAAQTGVLSSIQYPTGGTSQFIFEGNDYGSIAGIAQSQYQTYTVNEAASARDSSTIRVLNDTVNFTIDVSQTMSLYFTGWYSYAPLNDGPSVLLEKINSDGSDTTYFSEYAVKGALTVYPNVTPGNYRLITFVDQSDESINAYFSYSYTDSSVVINTFPTGGLRIRQIINTDPVSGQTNTKTYHYTSATNPAISSGNLESSPVYYETETSYTYPTTTYALVSSTSLNYLGFTQGSHVGYGTVTEVDSGTQNIGSKVSYFSANAYANPPGSIYYTKLAGVINSNLHPSNTIYKYQTDYDVLRGMLTKEVTFNAASQMVKQTMINYNISSEFSTNAPNFFQLNAIAGYTFWICHYGCEECFCPGAGDPESSCYACGYFALSNYTLADYSIISPWIYKTSVIDSIYDVNGANPFGQATYYYYDNPVHGLPTRIITVDSKGDSLKTVNKYAGDQSQISGLSTTASTALDSLISMNKIAAPIEIDHYNSNMALDLLRTDYQVWNTAPLVVAPQHTWYQTLSNPLEDRLDYYQYDTSCNLLEVSKTGDAHHSYLWDYHHQYLIAEVANAQQSDIAYTSFEADGSGNWTMGSGSVDSTTAVTGRKSYNLNGSVSKTGLNSSTTYIVSYWTMNNSAFSVGGTISGYPMQGKTEIINGNSWTLYVHKVTGQSTITVSGSGHIDELRLYPSTAQMTTYTYSPVVGMTSQTDVGNRVTYYQYDGLARLNRIRDQDYNILKTYEYEYQVSAGCTGCQSVAMETFLGTNTIGYPVGVFNIHGNLVGNAIGASAYVSLWNSDTADARVGTLSAGNDSLHFNIVLHTGQTLPASVTGCRYFQVDLPYATLDGIRNFNGTYVDFGDGTGMHLGTGLLDTPAVMAPNTTYGIQGVDVGYLDYSGVEYEHTYPNNNLKTLTFYHNDAGERSDFDNLYAPAPSLALLENLRGNLPVNTPNIGGSCYQQSTMTSVANITNWNSIHSIQNFRLNNGDQVHPCENIGYPQDFLANDPGLISIMLNWLAHHPGNGDSTFKLSRLKSNWNAYFTQLQYVAISEDDWNHEDLSGLTNLYLFQVMASGQVQDDPSSPLVPLDPTEIDNVIIQIAAGAARNVSNGYILFTSGGTTWTNNSLNARNYLATRGWTIAIDSTTR